MKKKIRKNTQLSFINIKRAGRPAKVDPGIRHTARETLFKPSALHLTIKVKEIKADIKNKRLLKALHHAMRRARLQNLKIVHYTLEYNHVHLVVQADNNKVLHKGMQALGISLAKAINKAKQKKGTVYKHRYHFRKLNSRRELKNALLYVFRNGMKHKRICSFLDPYNSLPAEKRITADMQTTIRKNPFLMKLRSELKEILSEQQVFYLNSTYLWE